MAVELADKDGRSDTFAIRRQMPALESICRFLSRKEQYSSWSTWRTFSMGQSMQSRHIWNFLQFQFESFVPAARSNLSGRERETYFPMKGWNPPKWLRMSWSNISPGGNRNIEMGWKTFSILKAKYKVFDTETRAWILGKIVCQIRDIYDENEVQLWMMQWMPHFLKQIFFWNKSVSILWHRIGALFSGEGVYQFHGW